MINFKQIVKTTETQRASLIESLIKKNLSKIEEAIWEAAKEGRYDISYLITIPSCFNNEEGKKDIINAFSNYFDDDFKLTLISPVYLFAPYTLYISWHKKED